MTYYSALHYAAKAEAAATTATTLLPYLTDITTVANSIASVNTVSADIASIITAATNIASINTVATSISDISAVVSNAANINTVATNISNVNTVATNISNVNSVAGDLTNIDAVAGDLTNINAVAADLTNIDNASQYAAEAKQWAIGDPSEPVDGSAKYWAQQAAGQVIPSQTGHSGEYLTTDGSALSWDSVDALPDQTGQSGKFLTTDGSTASWATASVTVDQVYDSTSANAQSGVAINGAKFIQNTATGAGSLSAGNYSSATGTNTVAFGFYAQAHANGALQIGQGQNTIENTFQVGSYRLLNTSTGIIPYQRINAITDSNLGGQLKTWSGTKAQYDAIVTKDANTLYNITDDVSQVEIDLNGKANTDLSNVLANIDFVVESQLPAADNDYTWYRKYKSGWVEQGGRVFATSNGEKTITFPKEFADTNYVAFKNIGINSSGNPPSREICCYAFTTTSMKSYINTDHGYASWEAKGMGAN